MKHKNKTISTILIASLIGVIHTDIQADTIVYVSNADDAIISRYKINMEDGTLARLASVQAGNNVMPLAVSHDKKHLYASIRSEPYQVITYAIKDSDGKLEKQATAPLPVSMAYISTDKKGKFLFGASYSDDLISVSAINNNGTVTDSALETYKVGRNAHSIVVHPNNRFVYVGNLGVDKILQYSLDISSGKLTPIGSGYAKTPEGAGPRHPVISPNGKYLYVINEMHASVSSYKIDQNTGALSLIETVSDFPADKYNLEMSQVREKIASKDFPKKIWSADIKITPNGKFLYATERTSNTLSAYRINELNGKLTYINTFPTEKQSRGIAIDPSGKYLIASGQIDDKIGIYEINQKTGELKRTGEAATGKNGNWIEIINTQE